jgi:hypothetical protein
MAVVNTEAVQLVRLPPRFMRFAGLPAFTSGSVDVAISA